MYTKLELAQIYYCSQDVSMHLGIVYWIFLKVSWLGLSFMCCNFELETPNHLPDCCCVEYYKWQVTLNVYKFSWAVYLIVAVLNITSGK